MKTLRPLKTISLLTLLTLFIFSCSEEGSNDVSQEEQQDTTQVAQEAQMDLALETMDDITLDVYEIQETSEQTRSQANFNLPDCVTVTVVLEQGYRDVTIDFGAEGCEVRGNILKGVVNLTYNRDPEARQVIINKSLTDFYFNDLLIEGTKSITKTFENTNGYPEYTKVVDVTVTWSDGDQASRVGTKTREWVEGIRNGIFSDNVFLITGNWTVNFKNGNTHKYEVTNPLRREVICYFYVSGSIDVDRTYIDGVLDFGSGNCDNQATFTFDSGEIRDIILDR